MIDRDVMELEDQEEDPSDRWRMALSEAEMEGQTV